MDKDVNVQHDNSVEQDIKNDTDSTISETFYLLTMPCIVLFFLEMLINIMDIHQNLFCLKNLVKFPIQFILEHNILIVPVLLTVSHFSESVLSVYMTVFLVCVSLLWWNISNNDNKATINDLILLPVSNQQVFITYFRSIVLIFSGMAILAVDFEFFPHKFTKTETTGYSAMDVGVGLFIVSNAIVSRFPNYDLSFVRLVKNTLPLILLGVGRCVFVHVLNYHTNEKEYGTHWNFFITLAVVKFLSFIIFKVSNLKVKNVFWVSTGLLLIHQYLLNYRFRDWVFSDVDRSSFIDANREGIVSSLGYEILYLFGILLKQYFPQRDQAYSMIDTLSTLFPMSIVFMMFHLFADGIDPVSRRLINASYIFWVLFVATAMLLICLTVEICNKIMFSKDLKEKYRVSLLLDAVNHNSLLYFLICNVLTGCVNLLIDTLLVDKLSSLIIVFSYMFLVNSIICTFYSKGIKLRF